MEEKRLRKQRKARVWARVREDEEEEECPDYDCLVVISNLFNQAYRGERDRRKSVVAGTDALWIDPLQSTINTVDRHRHQRESTPSVTAASKSPTNRAVRFELVAFRLL